MRLVDWINLVALRAEHIDEFLFPFFLECCNCYSGYHFALSFSIVRMVNKIMMLTFYSLACYHTALVCSRDCVHAFNFPFMYIRNLRMFGEFWSSGKVK